MKTILSELEALAIKFGYHKSKNYKDNELVSNNIKKEIKSKFRYKDYNENYNNYYEKEEYQYKPSSNYINSQNIISPKLAYNDEINYNKKYKNKCYYDEECYNQYKPSLKYKSSTDTIKDLYSNLKEFQNSYTSIIQKYKDYEYPKDFSENYIISNLQEMLYFVKQRNPEYAKYYLIFMDILNGKKVYIEKESFEMYYPYNYGKRNNLKDIMECKKKDSIELKMKCPCKYCKGDGPVIQWKCDKCSVNEILYEDGKVKCPNCEKEVYIWRKTFNCGKNNNKNNNICYTGMLLNLANLENISNASKSFVKNLTKQCCIHCNDFLTESGDFNEYDFQ
jgi:hypothetical protein